MTLGIGPQPEDDIYQRQGFGRSLGSQASRGC